MKTVAVSIVTLFEAVDRLKRSRFPEELALACRDRADHVFKRAIRRRQATTRDLLVIEDLIHEFSYSV